MAVVLDSYSISVQGFQTAPKRNGGVLRLSGIVDESIVDGPGLRMAVFAQGCPHRCAGCHNPGTHDFRGGRMWSAGNILERFDDNPLLSGLTLSGGEPLDQAAGMLPLARAVKERGKSVWCFTGYRFEELAATADETLDALLGEIDVLVDGRYDESRRSLSLLYRGSRNQRLLNLPLSLAAGKPVEWRNSSC